MPLSTGIPMRSPITTLIHKKSSSIPQQYRMSTLITSSWRHHPTHSTNSTVVPNRINPTKNTRSNALTFRYNHDHNITQIIWLINWLKLKMTTDKTKARKRSSSKDRKQSNTRNRNDNQNKYLVEMQERSRRRVEDRTKEKLAKDKKKREEDLKQMRQDQRQAELDIIASSNAEFIAEAGEFLSEEVIQAIKQETTVLSPQEATVRFNQYRQKYLHDSPIDSDNGSSELDVELTSPTNKTITISQETSSDISIEPTKN